MKLEGCRNNKHKECKQQLQKFYFGPKNQLVWMDEYTYCKCDKRGCDCFVKAADRKKKQRKRKS